MALAILSLTRGGGELGERLAAGLEKALHHPCRGRVRETLTRLWPETEGFICIMASGIVVRAIAPLLGDKASDPPVVVCDERGQFAISLLSGHLGGANELARKVAALLGGEAVITTASDVLGYSALDCWARDRGLIVADKDRFTRLMGRLVDQGDLRVFSDWPLADLPPDLLLVDEPLKADLCISDRTGLGSGLLLSPRSLVAGMGCNRNTPLGELEAALEAILDNHQLARQALAALATAEAKRDEPGLLALAEKWRLPLRFFSSDALNSVTGIDPSPAALRAIGAQGVAEPAALLGAGPEARLIVAKTKWPNVTVAITRCPSPLVYEGHPAGVQIGLPPASDPDQQITGDFPVSGTLRS